jgi:hypothetical protein
MITPFDIYLINELDGIRDFFVIIALVMFVTEVGVVCCICEEITNATKKITLKEFRGFFWMIFCLFSFSILGHFLVPTTKTAYEMYIIPTAVNSKLAQQLPSYLEQYIKKIIKEKS